MDHTILNEDEVRMLSASDYHSEEISQPRRLRLTMKYLYQLIGEIQQNNHLLHSRLNELEQQLYELYQIQQQQEEASSQELLNRDVLQIDSPKELAPPPVSELIETTRAERHPKPEKPSFWDFLMRR